MDLSIANHASTQLARPFLKTHWEAEPWRNDRCLLYSILREPRAPCEVHYSYVRSCG